MYRESIFHIYSYSNETSFSQNANFSCQSFLKFAYGTAVSLLCSVKNSKRFNNKEYILDKRAFVVFMFDIAFRTDIICCYITHPFRLFAINMHVALCWCQVVPIPHPTPSIPPTPPPPPPPRNLHPINGCVAPQIQYLSRLFPDCVNQGLCLHTYTVVTMRWPYNFYCLFPCTLSSFWWK